MQLALIHDGRVQAEADEATAALKGPEGKALFDIRDVSAVPGIELGWFANDDGTFTAPPEPAPTPEPPALDPVEKLRAFLSANPDVLEHIGAP